MSGGRAADITPRFITNPPPVRHSTLRVKIACCGGAYFEASGNAMRYKYPAPLSRPRARGCKDDHKEK